MNHKKILIVEDDIAIGNLIKMTIELHDYDYKLVTKGMDALKEVVSMHPDVIILDLGLPDMDGINVILKVRTWSKTPIIVVSARGEETEKIKALDMGADDYVEKPFSVDELLARVRVALRRSVANIDIEKEQSVFTNGPLSIDYLSNTVYVNNEEIHLTPNEYKLLETLSKNLGKVLTHNYLLKQVWGDALDTDVPNLRVFMATLRKKIEKDVNQPRFIQTHIRIGYRMIHWEKRK
ncbi:response regulator [Rummeliibacillus sp. POC4]|uniref:response regulator n=1 Tax=Rummeliibacillus sp. POC4 TaxID=2305899 RepID=UPI000E66C536|nr:response regulator transcription factor [Rummeliibacillus sp. POC4]RIJ69636.1 DNA-binding response regulator [Rummeliibacillus sp. POC4]